MSAVFIQRPLTRPQIIDSREGLFWRKMVLADKRWNCIYM